MLKRLLVVTMGFFCACGGTSGPDSGFQVINGAVVDLTFTPPSGTPLVWSDSTSSCSSWVQVIPEGDEQVYQCTAATPEQVPQIWFFGEPFNGGTVWEVRYVTDAGSWQGAYSASQQGSSASAGPDPANSAKLDLSVTKTVVQDSEDLAATGTLDGLITLQGH